MESPTKLTRNRKKCGHRLVVEASSLWTTESTPKWLLELMTRKNGTELKKVIKKILTRTDVSRGHSRLTIPFNGINDLKFLIPAEESIIAENQKKERMTGVDVKLVAKLMDSDGLREFDVNLRKWKMMKKSGSHTFVYNLVTWWNQVVQGCGQKKDNICLWSFHSDGKLYFARSSDSEKSKSEEIGSALVIYDKSNDDLPPK